MKIKKQKTEKGIALIAVVASALILAILGFSVLYVADSEILLTNKAVNRTKAFYLAEAGLARVTTLLKNKEYGDIENTELGEGTYHVDIDYDQDPPCAISTGRVGVEEKRLRVELAFLARPYEDAIYAGNLSGEEFTFELRGKGDPYTNPLGKEVGGNQ